MAFVKKGNVPVYIFMSQPGGFVSNNVKKVTKEPYNHVGISFEPSMKTIYTFGSKFKGKKMTGAGFTTDDIDGTYLGGKGASYALYVIFLTPEEVQRVKKGIMNYKKTEDKWKFNFLGLFAVWAKKPWLRNNKRFCSQFTAEMIKLADPKMIKKDSTLVQPYHFAKMRQSYFVSNGLIKDYSSDKTIAKVKEIKKKHDAAPAPKVEEKKK